MSTPQSMTVSEWAKQWAHAVGTWAAGHEGFKQYPFQTPMMTALSKPRPKPLAVLTFDDRRPGYSQSHWRKIRREWRNRRSAHMTIKRVAMPNAQGEFEPADIAMAEAVKRRIQASIERELFASVRRNVRYLIGDDR